MLTWRYEAAAADRKFVQESVASSGFFSEEEQAVALELLDDRLAKGIGSDYLFLFAEAGGQTRGYCCYGRIACSVHSYDLYWIVVHPEAQGRGIGRQLLQEVERLVAELQGLLLYAETSSRAQYEPTRGFYERCGYLPVAQLADFYALDDDKVIYSKRLR